MNEQIWELTAKTATVDNTTPAQTFTPTLPTVANCVPDNLLASYFAADDYTFVDTKYSAVKGQFCSTDVEVQRKMGASYPVFRNIKASGNTNLPYNM
jgi:hypothetical protein